MRSSCTGFAYIILLITIAALAAGAASSLAVGVQLGRRSSEEHLLFIGGEFERALLSYSKASGNAGPKGLKELLRDPRVPGMRRHLRRLYEDPLTGRGEWGFRRDAAGRIVGIYSLALGRPIKQQGFGPDRQSFAEATTYAQWVFGLPNARAPAPTTRPAVHSANRRLH
jgi:hypothetical protein